MKNITIFGGSGFLGEHLISRLKGNILVVARNEGNLIKLQQKFPHIKIQTGDISDIWTCKKAMKGADEAYLLAASKHVGLAEIDVRACVKSNVIGALNVIEESIISKPKLLVFISTDKAQRVSGVYGASKLLGERLMGEAERMNPATKYRTVLYGNILYSTGSVLCKWKELVIQGKELIVTEPEATRFFWTVDQAVDLIFEAIKKGTAKPYRPKVMKAMSIHNLLLAMLRKYENVKKPCKIKIIGLQAGENMHETLGEGQDSDIAPKYTVNEILKLI